MHFILVSVVHHWRSSHQSNGSHLHLCSSQAERQRAARQHGSGSGLRKMHQTGAPPLPAEGERLDASQVYVVVEYSESGGCVCNSCYSLLFSSGIPLRIVPLKRRFVRTATMYINQKNMEYRCLWAVPSKDNSSKEKISCHSLTSYLWSTLFLWSPQTLVNTVITLTPRCTPRLSKRTAWTPLASPPNCHQWRAPAFRSDSEHTHMFLKKYCRILQVF